MPIVRFPRFKRSLRLARDRAAEIHGERLARAIARLERRDRDLLIDIVTRLDPELELEEPAPDLPDDAENSGRSPPDR